MKGQITFTRVSTGDESYTNIRIWDSASNIAFVDIRMSMSEFADMITGVAHVPCELRVKDLSLVGKRREMKTEKVSCNGWKLDKRNAELYDAECDVALAPFEVDGWIGDRKDMDNHKNYVGDGFIRVTFTRYVDVEGEADAQ